MKILQMEQQLINNIVVNELKTLITYFRRPEKPSIPLEDLDIYIQGRLKHYPTDMEDGK